MCTELCPRFDKRRQQDKKDTNQKITTREREQKEKGKT
jgi:hypothetical protein